MSGKSIQPLQATACYLPINPGGDPSERIRLFFSKLFKHFQLFDSVKALAECQPEGEKLHALVLDLRGDDAQFEALVSSYVGVYRSLAPQVVLALCDQDQMERISRLATEGFVPQHLLTVPWNKGVLERVIEDLRDHLQHSATMVPQTETLMQLNKGGNREYIDKLDTANAFYADRSQMMREMSRRLVRLVKNIMQDEVVREVPHAGRLIQYAEVLDQGIEEMVQFSTQNWHAYQHQTTLDINTVLDTVSSTSIPFLKDQGVELIFEVSNNVPARLKGYPLGMIRALVTVLELIVQARIHGKLIMRISLKERDGEEGAALYVQFLQNHYRGSVASVILSHVRQEQQFSDLLEQMDEIDGLVLHADGTSEENALQLVFHVQMLDRRSYRLPTRDIMDKKVLIIDDRQKNAEVLQKMLNYFHLASTVSAQLDEALTRVQEHEYDVVIVTEKLAKRCTKTCKQAQSHEKFIVVNTKKGTYDSYLGLDLADSFLSEPYTHKGIFNAIVDIFSDESIEGRMEDVLTLKSYLSLLVKNRRLAYVGNSGMTARNMEAFLEETGMQFASGREPESVPSTGGQYDFVFQSVDPQMLQDNLEGVEALLKRGSALSQDGRIVCVVPEEMDEEAMEKIAPYMFVITYLQEPIDPEVFYKILLDWAMGV